MPPLSLPTGWSTSALTSVQSKECATIQRERVYVMLAGPVMPVMSLSAQEIALDVVLAT